MVKNYVMFNDIPSHLVEELLEIRVLPADEEYQDLEDLE
jgi:hypothetical protein